MRAAELEAGQLSVEALKAELTLLKVPHADAVEKSDLVDRLIQARQLQSPGCDGKSAATFASADAGEDKLSVQELDGALRSAGVEWSPSRVRCLHGLLDVDGDGRVGKEEFKKTLEQVATAINAVARAPICTAACAATTIAAAAAPTLFPRFGTAVADAIDAIGGRLTRPAGARSRGGRAVNALESGGRDASPRFASRVDCENRCTPTNSKSAPLSANCKNRTDSAQFCIRNNSGTSACESFCAEK